MLEFSAHMLSTSNTRAPLVEGPFDLAVLGGGINGTAIARDAALRGKSVLLLEKGDLGQGTSSRSSKMAHGGIRYLEQLRLGLVHEALRERHYLLQLAPHLVRPQTFVLPIYSGARRGPFMIRLGLFLYDKLALGRRPGKCRGLAPAEILARVPALRAEGLIGGGLYYDAVMDDARLVLLNALAALEESSSRPYQVVIRNYCEALEVHPGSPCRLLVRDHLTGEERSVRAHHVVRALGPWTDPDRLVPSKGVHLVLPPFPVPEGLLLTHSGDGRVFFVIPWLGRTVVGTTETIHEGPPENLRVEKEEAAYLLDELRRLFPGLKLGGNDVLATYAGIRPLARERSARSSGAPGSVSRYHRIDDDGSGVVDVYGGKYTTYRAVARGVCDRLYPGTTCTTHLRPLPGGEAGAWKQFLARCSPEARAVGEARLEHLFHRYGARLTEILALEREDPTLAQPLSPGLAETRSEVVHAVTRELVVYPEDFLSRRTTLRFSAGGGRSAYDAVEAAVRAHAPVVPQDLPDARQRYFQALEWEDELRAWLEGRTGQAPPQESTPASLRRL